MAEHAHFFYPHQDFALIEKGETDRDAMEWDLIHGSSVETFYGQVPVADLWSRFVESEYHAHMQVVQPCRYWEHYGELGQSMLQMIGGQDIDPVLHQVNVASYVGWILLDEVRTNGELPIHTNEIGTVYFANLIHDIGEVTHDEVRRAVGAVVGDIPYGQKTNTERAIEKAVRQHQYQKFWSDVDSHVLEMMEGIIMHKDKTNRGLISELGHALATFQTGLDAKRAAETGRVLGDGILYELTSQQRDIASDMGKTVIRRMVPEILAGRQFSLAQRYIKAYGLAQAA